MNPIKQHEAARHFHPIAISHSVAKRLAPLVVGVLAGVFLAIIPARAQQAPPTVTTGTRLRVKFDTEVGTAISRVGDEVEAHLIKPVKTHGRQVVLPVGTILTGRVAAVRAGNRHTKTFPMIHLQFTRIILPNGEPFPIQAQLAGLGMREYVDPEGVATTKRETKLKDTTTVLGAGGAGAALGGAKGAGIGAGIGALLGVAAHKAQWQNFTLKRGRKASLRLDHDLVLTPSSKRIAKARGGDGPSKYGTAVGGKITGTYSGVVTNLTAGDSGNFRITVNERGVILRGCMAVRKPLYGSGPLNGTVTGDHIVFQVDSKLMSIVFTGQDGGTRISGTYVVRPVRGPLQHGRFRLERSSSRGLPGGFSGFNPDQCPKDATVHGK